MIDFTTLKNLATKFTVTGAQKAQGTRDRISVVYVIRATALDALGKSSKSRRLVVFRK